MENRLEVGLADGVIERLLGIIDGGASRSTAVPRALEVLGRALGFAVGVVWIPDEAIGRLRCSAYWAVDRYVAPEFGIRTRATTYAPGEGVLGAVWETTSPVWDPEHAVGERLDDVRRFGLEWGFVVPVVCDSVVTALVEMHGRERRVLEPAERHDLTVLGASLGRPLRRLLDEDRAQGERARLELALHAGRMGAWDWDMRTNIVRWSATLEASLGRPPSEFVGTVEDFVATVHEDDREATVAAFAATMQPGADPVLELEYRVVGDDGSVRWIETRGQAIFEAGEAVAMMGVAADITERQEAQFEIQAQRARLEAAIGTDAGTGVGVWDYDVVTGTGWVSPNVAEVYGIPAEAGLEHFLEYVEADERGDLTDVLAEAVANPGPIRLERTVVLPGERRLVVEVRGRPVFDDRGRVAKLTGVVLDVTERRRSEERLRRAYTEREQVARALRASLLPPALPEPRGFDFGAAFRSSEEGVAGDFYDVFPLSRRRWAVAIGDVSGKGPDAARVTALARYSMRTAALLGEEPEAVLGVVNEALRRDLSTNRLCTAVFARLRRTRAGTWLEAGVGGHPRPVVLRATGAVQWLDDTGTILGATGEPRLARHDVLLSRGDTVVLYTDGVTEARGERGRYGEARLEDSLRGLEPGSAQDVADRIANSVERFEAGPHRDDLAVLVVRVR